MSVAPPPPPMPSENGSRNSGYQSTAQFNGDLPPPAPLSPPLPPMPDDQQYNNQGDTLLQEENFHGNLISLSRIWKIGLSL